MLTWVEMVTRFLQVRNLYRKVLNVVICKKNVPSAILGLIQKNFLALNNQI